jgi:broad specificity phosphatase PhoE
MTQELVLLLMRHGQIAQHPGDRRFVGSRDLPLDDTGRAQARAAGRALADLEGAGLSLRRVFTSDLRRAVDTAEIATAALAAAPEHTRLAELREICLGDWEGLSTEEVRARFPGRLERRGRDMAGVRPSGGESFADLTARVLPALDRLARSTLAAGDRLALVVAHGGVNRAILCAALGLPLAQVLRLPQDYACLNILVWKPEGLAVRAVNLAAGALAPGWAAAYGLGDRA